MLRQQDKAEDAAQDIFIKTYKSLHSFKGESAFSTWLYRLASNHCLDLIRSDSRKKTESWEELLQIHGEKIEKLFSFNEPFPSDNNEITEWINSLLEELKPDYRLILTMRESQNLSYQEIADTLHLTLDSVKSKLRRARQELNEKYDTFISSKTSNPRS